MKIKIEGLVFSDLKVDSNSIQLDVKIGTKFLSVTGETVWMIIPCVDATTERRTIKFIRTSEEVEIDDDVDEVWEYLGTTKMNLTGSQYHDYHVFEVV